MSEGVAETIVLACAIGGVVTLGLIADRLEKISKALERIANRDR
jgi:hypothetical protein